MRPRVLLLALPVTWLACFSPTGSGVPSAEFDAGPGGAVFDASTPDGEAPDAAAAEAGWVDASKDVVLDVGPAPVTVVVGGARGFEAGVPVVFADATGAPIFTGATSGAGIAAMIVPAGGMVTVLLGTPSQPAPYTVMGLASGDQVLVVDRGSLAALPPILPLVAGAPLDAGVGDYEAFAGVCTSTSMYASLPMNLAPGLHAGPCVGLGPIGNGFGAAYPVVVEAQNGSGGVLGYAFSRNNGITMPDEAGNLEVTLPPWSTGTVAQTLALADLPDATASAAVAYSEIADGILTPLPQIPAPAGEAGLPPAQLVHTHPGFADAVQTELVVSPQPLYTPAGIAIVTAGAPPTTSGTVTLDASLAAAAPAFTAAAVTSPTAGQPVVGWTLAGGDLHAMTGVVAQLGWSAITDGGAQNGVWTLVAPGTAASTLQAPALPSTLSGFAPASGATFAASTLFAIDGRTAMPTYASMLPIGSLFVSQAGNCYVGLPAVPPLPRPGVAVVSIFSPGGGC